MELRTEPSSSCGQKPESLWRRVLKTRTSSRRRNSWSHRNKREYWFQPVHRHRVSFIPDLEDIKFLAVFEDLVGTSVEWSQQRFRSVIVDEHKLSIQEGLRKRLRLRWSHMMTRRTRETRDGSLHFPKKNLWRKLRVFDELALGRCIP